MNALHEPFQSFSHFRVAFVRLMAYCWNQITVRVVLLADGEPTIRSGSALSIFRKEPNGSWVLVRDANLLAPAS